MPARRELFSQAGCSRIVICPLPALVLLLALCLPGPAAPAAPRPSSSYVPEKAGEQRASVAFERARRQGRPALRAFFYAMPKGADLHNHLGGAVYAETFIQEAAQDHLCIRLKTLTLYRAAGMTRSLPAQPVCGEEGEPAAAAMTDQHLYDRLIDAMSMRIFVPTAAETGHDHFFDTFDRFLAVDASHLGEWLDEVASRAAAQNEQYLELMQTPDLTQMAQLSSQLGPVDMQTDFAHLRRQLLDRGLRSELPVTRAQFDDGLARRQAIEHCDGAQPAAGCRVEIRYIYQVLRALPPQMVFAQLITGFELASTDPLIVGINMVQPEDNRVAMADYRLHMEMIHELHKLYPKVHIALHAGELAPGMVPPIGLTFHIRSAVEEAHAERIGHGVDIMHEIGPDGGSPYGLLREMAAHRVMVEINLTSNDVILNIKDANHPFMLYRQWHVPVALSTDDEGVSRIDLTHEYVRAALAYPLTYADFKQMARTSLEHSFLPGDSLWEQSGEFENYNQPRAVCRAQLGRGRLAQGACANWLQSSEKARQQFELERRFHAFENSLPGQMPFQLSPSVQ